MDAEGASYHERVCAETILTVWSTDPWTNSLNPLFDNLFDAIRDKTVRIAFC